jgi:hypothetical protein
MIFQKKLGFSRSRCNVTDPNNYYLALVYAIIRIILKFIIHYNTYNCKFHYTTYSTYSIHRGTYFINMISFQFYLERRSQYSEKRLKRFIQIQFHQYPFRFPSLHQPNYFGSQINLRSYRVGLT